MLKTDIKDKVLSTVTWAVSALTLMCMLTSCSKINSWLHLDDDNFLEESCEAVLEEHTGIDVDFTPFSSER